MPVLPWSASGGGDDEDGALRDRLLRVLGRPAATAPPLVVAARPPLPTGAVDLDPGALSPVALVDPTRRGGTALLLVAALAAVLTVFVVWRSRPQPVAVAPPSVVAPEASGGSSAGPDGSGQVVVDVQGAVRRPGLVTLPAGSRVADAIAAAGGLKPGATTLGLNLARRVSDGEQVLVLPPGATPPPAPAGQPGATTAGARLDLNLATVEQLDALPGVGPVTAQRIIAWRTEHGRFASVDQLREVDGIGDKRFATLRDLVVV